MSGFLIVCKYGQDGDGREGVWCVGELRNGDESGGSGEMGVCKEPSVRLESG